MEYSHKPVLLRESIEALNIRPDGVYVDGTLGRAGHSKEIARRLTTGRLICIDRDQAAIDAAKAIRISIAGPQQLRELGDILRLSGVGGADGMLFDLGVSSPQLDDASRGFSYMHDAPLDMRMDTSAPLSAYEVVNTWSQEELRRILYEYGEERYAPAIARAIVRARENRPGKDHPGAGGDHQKHHAPRGPAGEAAPRQAELSGHPHRRQRRAGRPAPHAGGGGGRIEPRRPAGGDHLPLPGGPGSSSGPWRTWPGAAPARRSSRCACAAESPGSGW